MDKKSTCRQNHLITAFALLIAGLFHSLSASAQLNPLPGPEILENTIGLEHNSNTACILQEAGDIFCWLNVVSSSNPMSPTNLAGHETLNATLNNDIAEISLGFNQLCARGNSSGIDCVFFDDSPFNPNFGLDQPPEPNASYIAMSSIESSGINMCAIQTDNRTVCWGSADTGVNDIPPEAQFLKQVDVDAGRACGVDLNDTLICWGTPGLTFAGVDLQFGTTDITTIGTINQVSLSEFGACVITTEDQLNCFAELERFTDVFADRQFSSVVARTGSGPSICFEETDGNKDCRAVFTENGELFSSSRLPDNANPRLISFVGNSCTISVNNVMQCAFFGDNSPVNQFPIAPANLSIEEFSATSIELFWERPSAFNGNDDFATGYEIYINDELVDRIGIVTSYFDGNAEPNASYSLRPIRGAIGGTPASISRTETNPVTPTTPITPPTTGENITAPVISIVENTETRIELIWNDTGNPDVRYTVLRDNVPVVTDSTDLFYIDTDVEAGTTYVYTVMVGLNGENVAQSGLLVTSPGETVPLNNTPNFSGIERFSDSAVEVSWVRSPFFFTAFYELRRNGELIDDQLDALSFFDTTATASQSWTYELIAVDGEGNRSSPASISIGAGSGTTPVEPPAPPTGPTQPPVGVSVDPPTITGEVYSSSSIEIFWNRLDDPSFTYNVTRDNVVVLSNSRASSFFDDGLDAGTSYVYAVSISQNGNVLASSSRTFTTNGTFASAPVPTPEPAPVPTTEPGGQPVFTGATRYSTTALEIFWQGTPDVTTVFYELTRNGTLINAQLDALSFFDAAASSNESWTYTLVGIDSNGNRSEPASITIDAGFNTAFSQP